MVKTATTSKKPAIKKAVAKKIPKTKEAASVKSAPIKSSSIKPTTMAELLAGITVPIVVPQKGQTIKGKVKEITKKALVLDINAKTEGVVTDKEFDLAVDYIGDLKPGDEVEAIVISQVTDRGQILLSLKQAAMESKWDLFTKAMADDQILDAKGVEINKGGLIVVVEGMRGFVPSSQFGKSFLGNIKALKGKTIKVKAIEVDKEKNRLIFSERHVSEASELAQRDLALSNVKAGTTYGGTVSGVMPFGLFVTVEVPVAEGSEELGHVEGLIHISEISWEKVNNPGDYHKVGDKIQVKVLGVDEQTGKLNLSLKQLSDDPWTTIGDKYSVGTTFTGTVTRVESFGVFVNVEPGVDGLIHMSKLTPGVEYKRGDQVTVTVESVEPQQRRMSLSPVNTADEMPLYK